ncbi:epithelial cell-transforming sequence 2 oncogene-like isoform X2 [Hypanus sabinus]|uniref:epithelial cell-transforming sequence 2 oncogene-like isoform X2 n=1 Tax=Hypanus sabinus TaxID=79690 RepID=UPI0028C3A7C9|nr:epithelial cell-transforming sequence 2 oncogene-like isoform X2 [Hypanus sabinus]
MEGSASQKVPGVNTMVFIRSKTLQRSLRHWEKQAPSQTSREPDLPGRVSDPKSSSLNQQTRLSTWTPIIHKAANQQLFEERVTLVGHWFDLWTDKQRKQFIHSILKHCTKSQLKFAQDWFTEAVPIDKVDFTAVMPRFLSLYVFSFLSPRQLCLASQVNWHWRFLTEQDCLWMPKCVKHGWFLPYSPPDYEYGAWKRHYIACVRSLDYLTPAEAARVYGVVVEPKEATLERQSERSLRRWIQERLTRQKRDSLSNQPPWLSGKWTTRWYSTRARHSPTLGDRTQASVPLSHLLSEESMALASRSPALGKHCQLGSAVTLCTGKNLSGGGPYPTSHSTAATPENGTSNHPRLVLISSRIPAWEVALDCVRVEVIPVVYDHCGTTLESLLFRVEQVLRGRRARSIGILAEGDLTELDLVQGCKISSKNLPDAKIREFWENLASCILSQEEGGDIHIFVPLAASEAGMELLSQLSALTAVCYNTPTGMVTGSYQHVFSEWLWAAGDPSPPARYFNEKKLLSWTRMAEVSEELHAHIRKAMEPHCRHLQRHLCGRLIGQLMFDSMSAAGVQQHRDIAPALTEGLIEMSREQQEDPLGFLSNFLMSRSRNNKLLKPGETFLTEVNGGIMPLKESVAVENGSVDCTTIKHPPSEGIFEELTHLNRRLFAGIVDKRTQLAKEALTSEREYVQTLEIVKNVYWAPLKAAVASNRAILTVTNIHCIFTYILSILDLNRNLLGELTDRLHEWSPSQCLGDVFIRFSNRLRVYTNYFNNYGAVLKTIDKCRETIPSFRAFLARHERTPVTKMLSLHEVLMTPATRFEEYAALLHALRLNTPAEHADHRDLTTAVTDLECFRDYIRQLKVQKEREEQMMEAQTSIGGSPILLEGNRYLIHVQDMFQMNVPDGKVCATLRIYEYISDLTLFLFNDALLFASRRVSHLPFKRNPKTSLRFLASVALSRLFVEDIPDSKYVRNAFVLQGLKRHWICAMEREEDKITWLSILESAIHAAVEET